MKTKLSTILSIILVFAMLSCNKDNNNNGNNYNDEIIEYQGDYPAPQSIEYEENGVTYEIEAIPGQIILSADVDHNTVVNAVNANGGKIIQQYPQYGDYLVEVAIGNENAFLTAMNKLNITADLNIVEYPKEKYDYFVFDDFIDVNGIQHGKKVSSILSDCQNGSVINEINLYTPRIPNWVPGGYGGVALNLCRFKFGNLLSQNQVLVNWSNGYGSNDDDWQSMTEEQKQNFTKGWKMSVKLILDKIIWLKKKNPNIDIVFAQAAGNEKCPKMAQMINDLKSNPKYNTILEENMIFVSDYSAFANSSTEYGDFCYIKEHPYFAPGPNGGSTSFASPQALCYINQVIKGTIGEDGKNITAEQALAAVKAAIRQNSNGELDLEEALEMARNMYGGSYVDLGLPNGILWATRNVGANSPEERGYYFAWGETQEKSYYDWDTYRYYNTSTNSVTKYNTNDGLTTLQQNDDAATYILGNGQRMPTYDDWNELMTHCTQTYTTLNGVKGVRFTASNGNSIFLPAVGFHHEGGIFDGEHYPQHYDGCGLYWTSSRSEDNPNNAWYVLFKYNTETLVLNEYLRLFGLPVRPVRVLPTN